jgi:hypothetical protein
MTVPTARVGTGVREAPRHEIAVGDARAVPRELWGFGGWAKFAGDGLPRLRRMGLRQLR